MKFVTRCSIIILSFFVLLGNCKEVFAQDMEQQNETGTGKVEGNVEKNVYQVILPTISEGTFDFIIDPQGLINETNGAAYGNKIFSDDSTLFFKRTDGKVGEDYSNTSDEITITNMSSVPVMVSVNVSIQESSLGGITLSDDREFTDDTSTSLYMALIDGENIIPIGREGVSFDVMVDAAPEGTYVYTYNNAEGKYDYRLADDLGDIEFHKYSFQLTGATNGKGDWSQLDDAAPKINVAWKISAADE